MQHPTVPPHDPVTPSRTIVVECDLGWFLFRDNFGERAAVSRLEIRVKLFRMAFPASLTSDVFSLPAPFRK
jgi:hypothetical protein